MPLDRQREGRPQRRDAMVLLKQRHPQDTESEGSQAVEKKKNGEPPLKATRSIFKRSREIIPEGIQPKVWEEAVSLEVGFRPPLTKLRGSS